MLLLLWSRNVEKLTSLKIMLVKSLFVALALAPSSLFADGMNPILPLPAASKRVPLLEETLRDPSLVRSGLSDDLAFEQIDQDIAEATSDLKTANGGRRLELLQSLYLNHALRTYYTQDALNGRVQSSYSKSHATRLLEESRAAMRGYASQYAKLAKSPKNKARALYHVLANRFVTGSRGEAVRGLDKISKHLPGALKTRAQFMASLNDLETGNIARGEQTMNAIMGGLSRDGKIAARLALARAQAGARSAAYRNNLMTATKSASGLPAAEKERILAFSVQIWNKADGSGSWDKAPIYLKGFGGSPTANAIEERRAISLAQAGKYDAAIGIYKNLSYRYEGTKRMVALDRRQLDIELAKFQKTKKLAPYERALVFFTSKYSSEDVLSSLSGETGKEARLEFSGRYRSFVSATIAAAQKSNATSAFRRDAIRMAATYHDSISDATEQRAVKYAIARIYALNQQHRQAVAVYRDLIADAQGEDLLRYLSGAIASQHVVAKWPNQPPFGGAQNAPAGDRAALADLYAKLYSANGKKPDWFVASHLGLLQIQIGQSGPAFRLWLDTLGRNAEGPLAAQASGMMLVAFNKAKDWTNLEKIADLVISKGVQARRINQKLDARTFLADALYFGGKQSYAAKDYKEAARRLARFSNEFKGEKRRHEAMYVLAHAYRGNGQHPEAVKTLIAQVEEYPNSPFNKQALLEGGDWSTPMAYEEQAIFFYSRFLKRYDSDKQAIAVRQKAARLYIGRELYGYATRIFQAQSMDKRVPVQRQIDAAVAYMDIEERFGDVQKAKWGANRIQQLPANDGVKAQAMGFEARHFAKDSLAKLETMEKKLASMDTDSPTVVENLALVRFMIADKKSQRTQGEIFNLEVKDPQATLDRHYGLFNQTKADYEKICAAGENIYCAPAMLKVSRLTENTIKTIQDLTIPETLDADSVVKFNNRKQAIMGALADAMQASSDRSMKLASDGSTTPDYNEEITWTNSVAWDLDQIVGETGNSFVQWNPTSSSADE